MLFICTLKNAHNIYLVVRPQSKPASYGPHLQTIHCDPTHDLLIDPFSHLSYHLLTWDGKHYDELENAVA